MFPPWYMPSPLPGRWGKTGKGPATAPGYGPPSLPRTLPVVAQRPSASPAPGRSNEAIPSGVEVVADLPVARPSMPILPDHRMAWSPDGRYLLYIGAPGPGGRPGPLMLLDVKEPERPRPVAEEAFFGGFAFHPDGRSFVYTASYRTPDGQTAPTIFQQRLDGGEPVNLLPPEVTPPLKLGFIHRWLDDRTLAFDESVGTGVRRTLLLDTAERKLIQTPGLVATYFNWAPPGNRLAGETMAVAFPAEFWLWDRPSNRFLFSPVPEEKTGLPGKQHFFETWSPDGRVALFSAWEQEVYNPGPPPALYRMDPVTGQTALLAEGAALAAWSGDWIAYVRIGPSLTLVMTRAADNQMLWTDDLGPRPPDDAASFPWTYWPQFAGPFVAYRTSAGEWRVSRADRKEVRPIYRGESVDLLWAPDGRHIALLHTNETARLTVVKNPLLPARTSALAIVPRRHEPHELPPGPALEQAVATAGVSQIPPGVKVVADLPARSFPPATVPIRLIDWSPDGRRLLYVGAPPPTEEFGHLMLLDLAEPTRPTREADGPIENAVWHPDGNSFAYVAVVPDLETGIEEPAIFHKPVGRGGTQNLLPPGVSGPDTWELLQRWLDERTLAFDQNAGATLRRTLLLDTARQRLIDTQELSATFFYWTDAGDRLAGQVLLPRSTYFWIWDRLRNQFLFAPELPAQEYQFFEAWAPDGSALLYSEWDRFPILPGARPTLYRKDLATGDAAEVADGAGLAAWYGGLIAYVKWGPRLTLVMTRAADNRVLWTDDLGPIPESSEFPLAFRPHFAGPYVAYRTADAEWRVSLAERKEVRPMFRGEPVRLHWAPDGRHFALLHTNETGRLLVVANPLEAAPPGANAGGRVTLAEADLGGRSTAAGADPAGRVTVAQAGRRICLRGVIRAQVIPPAARGPIRCPTVRWYLEGAGWRVLLAPSPGFVATLRGALGREVDLCGITRGVDRVLGPVVEPTGFL